MEAADKVLNLLFGDKFHIDSGRAEILEAVAAQINHHRKGENGTCNSKEMEAWATILSRVFHVDNRRDKSKSVSAESLVTELNSIVSRLYSREPE